MLTKIDTATEQAAQVMEDALVNSRSVKTVEALKPMLQELGKGMEEVCRGVNQFEELKTEAERMQQLKDLKEALTEIAGTMELLARRVECPDEEVAL